MQNQTPFTISGESIKAGQRQTVRIPVAGLYTHTEMFLPVHVIHGRQPGPCLMVCAAVHGDEIVGTEIIHRLMKIKRINRVRGTLLAVPVVNVYGFVQNSRYSPDRRDLNRFFPGSEKGSLTSRLADVFMREVADKCTHAIDLHAGSNHRTNLPQIRVDTTDPINRELALAFRSPVIVNAQLRDGSLRSILTARQSPYLLYEGGEASRFDETAIRAGLRGTLAVMEALGMLRSSATPKKPLAPLIAESTRWVRAPASGLLHMSVPLGSRVNAATKLGKIVDPFGGPETVIHSPISGMVIGRLNMPLVHQGDAVIHVAEIEKPAAIAPLIQKFNEDIAIDD
jgi:uncharacterized protein